MLLTIWSSFSGYSDWVELPLDDPDQYVTELVEDLKFQIKTDAAITITNNMKMVWKGPGWINFIAAQISAHQCVSFTLSEDIGFRTDTNGGILTFLKTNTHLKIWYDSDADGEGSDDDDLLDLEVDWKFEAKPENACSMTRSLTGIKFRANSGVFPNTPAAVAYRYSLPVTQCTALNPAWTTNHVTTSASFPVPAGTVITVSCPAGYTLGGDDTVTCTEDTDFSHDGTVPSCVIGKFSKGIRVYSLI